MIRPATLVVRSEAAGCRAKAKVPQSGANRGKNLQQSRKGFHEYPRVNVLEFRASGPWRSAAYGVVGDEVSRVPNLVAGDAE